MRIYLSGPITNEPNYRRNFAAAQSILEEMGHDDIVNPAELQSVINIKKMPHKEAVAFCFDLLDHCDAMLQLPGWQNSKGCMAEWGYALGQGNIILMEFEDYVKRG